jgi:toxin secretion/phage lysis holin
MLRVIPDYLSEAAQGLVGGFATKATASTVTASVCLWIGGQDGLVETLFYLVCLDFALGVAHGWRVGKFSQSKIIYGLAKYLLYFLTLTSANLIDTACNLKASMLFHFDFRGFFVLYLCFNEFISVLGHLHFFGVPFPEWLMRRLRDYRDCKFLDGQLPPTGGKA